MNAISSSLLAPAWPLPDEEVRAALLAAYADGSWGKYEGPHSAALVEALQALVGSPHVTLCSSGTIAVELALRGLRIGPGDEVVLAGYDFPGNFRAIEALGAIPVLVDLSPHSWRINPDDLPGAINSATRAILVSHLHGDLAEMPRICEFAAACGVAIVEDCCQVPGAVVAGRPAGAWGDVSVFSFGGSKLLTAGRGGAVLTTRDDVQQRIRIANDRGNQAFPLSELQAAVLLPQINKLSERNAQRLVSVQRMLGKAANWRGIAPLTLHGAGYIPTFYKLPLRFDYAEDQDIGPEQLRARWIGALHAAGLAIDEGFRGFVRRSSARCRRIGELTHSRLAAERTLLWHHPLLLQPTDIIDRAVETLIQVSHAFSADE